MDGIARPSLEDPLVAAGSEAVGGPVGQRALPHPWWTPVRVVLAVTCVAFVLGMLQKSPCAAENWTGGDLRYARMCYSDVPYLYSGRGFAEREFPFSDTGGRYPAMEYPVLIGYFAYGATLVTHTATGWPDVTSRADLPTDRLWGLPAVQDEVEVYVAVTAALLGLLALAAAYFLSRAQRGRPWDAMLFAASPALVLAGLINWDLLAVALLAAALWAWSRGRPRLSGVLIGLGTAAKLYPLFLLGALLVVCLRTRSMRAWAAALGAAVAAWLLVNAPALLLGFDQWQVFWSFNSDRGADLGSLWLVWQQAGHQVDPGFINTFSWAFFGGVCVSVFAVGVVARRTPRIAQLAFLVLAGFLLVNKVYSPQYVLWLLPLAVLARPRWRDLLIWQAGEVFYFGAVWLYLGGYTASGATGQPDHVYWLAILLRVAALLYLVTMVVRDIFMPWLDPVRADGITEDPLHPVPAARRARRRGPRVAAPS